MEVESKLIPILREGVDIIKMVFFKKLKTHLAEKYPDSEPSYINRLSGAVINDIFGTSNTEEPFATFVKENEARIEEELSSVSTELEEMRIPLTDALRVQFLCDHQEGIDSTPILIQAEKCHILLVDREVPLPAKFMTLVRTLGSSFNIIEQSAQ